MPIRTTIRIPTRKDEPAKYRQATQQEINEAKKNQQRDNKIIQKVKRAIRVPVQNTETLDRVGGYAQTYKTPTLDIGTAIKNQQAEKEQQQKDYLYNINLMLKSLETISAGYGLAGGVYGWLARRRLLSKGAQILGDMAANRNLVSRTTAQLPSLYINALELNTAKPVQMLNNANQYFGAAIDGVQIFTQPDLKDKVINGVELFPLMIKNKYPTTSAFGGALSNMYDLYQNTHQ